MPRSLSAFVAKSAVLMLAVMAFSGWAQAALAKTSTPYRLAGATDYVIQDPSVVSAVVMDERTKKILYSFNPDKVWTTASLTKLMGALVFLDQKPYWNKVVSIKAQDEVGGGRLRVNDGATLTVQDVLYSSLVGSANNAATALSRISGLGQTKFVAAMNRKAKVLGCENTVYTDPSGMDTGNMTTANDMLKIADAAFNRYEIRRPASTAVYSFKIRNSGQLHTIRNTNQLLIDPDNGLYVTGGKTGYLDEARNNLVVRLRPDARTVNQELVIVVFGAANRAAMFDEVSSLAHWAWKAYSWSTPQLTLK